MKSTFFPTPAHFRRWLERHHAAASELWVGFYKKASGKPSITWPESVDEALCYGWIDGIRKSIDDISYQIRFTPRRADSTWSRVNISRAQALIEQRRMQPAGLKAYEARVEDKSSIFSYEQRSVELQEPYSRLLKKNKDAWTGFQAQAPSYRRTVGWWIVSAKKEETRVRRLEKLIAYSARGQKIPEMVPSKPAKSKDGV